MEEHFQVWFIIYAKITWLILDSGTKTIFVCVRVDNKIFFVPFENMKEKFVKMQATAFLNINNLGVQMQNIERECSDVLKCLNISGFSV